MIYQKGALLVLQEQLVVVEKSHTIVAFGVDGWELSDIRTTLRSFVLMFLFDWLKLYNY